ncbi:MAG: histidine phosphatase family protein [Hahellaceae bacterium]|nr:histidine phosphatase family protein [Hahellaceae bacterium]MCP5170089.1 histidine phosphatase family protein [Hahellaceae bacterium]
MGAIYLIRHGQASFGHENYDQLSARGQTQARLLGDYLRQAGIRFDHVYSGTLERQRDTAQLALAQAESAAHVIENPAFNEFDHLGVTRAYVKGLAEGDSLVEDFVANRIDRVKYFQPVFEKVVRRWASGEFPIPGVESWKAFNERVGSGLQQVISEVGRSQNVAIFTSGGPITALMHQLLEVSSEIAFSMNWSIVNASVTKLMYSEHKTSLAYFNDHGYLQGSGDRTLVTFR